MKRTSYIIELDDPAASYAVRAAFYAMGCAVVDLDNDDALSVDLTDEQLRCAWGIANVRSIHVAPVV